MGLDYIRIRNFRAFNGIYDFKIAPLTLLIGTNSSGKSSVLKAILLLQNSFNKFYKKDNREVGNSVFPFYRLMVNDKLNLSHFDKWLNDQQQDNGEISFTFPFHFKSMLEEFEMEVCYINDGTIRKGGRLNKLRIYEKETYKDVIMVNDGSVDIDVAYLWQCVANYNNNFIDKLSKFDREIRSQLINNFVDISQWEYEEDTDSYFGLDWHLNDMLEHFLTNEESFNIKKGAHFISLSEFTDILSEKQKETFLFLRTIFLTKKLSFNKRPLISSSFIRELRFVDNHQMPFLTYNLTYNQTNVNKESGRVKFQLDDTQKEIAKQLLQLELHYLESYLSHNAKGNPHEKNCLATDLIDSLLLQLDLATNPMKSFEQLRTMMKLSASNFRTYVERKKASESLSHLPELLSNKDAEDYEKKYSVKSNLKIFIEKIILGSINENFTEIVSDISQVIFVPPYRNAIPKRSFNVSEDQNYFAKVLKSLLESPKEQLASITKFAGEVLQQMGIANSISISVNADGDAVSVLLNKNGIERNLADYGHGVGQLIPTLFRLAFEHFRPSSNKKGESKRLIVLEEPETNLHPALQSRLADMLHLIAQKLDCKLIIETHSEYLIRRLQVLTIDNTSNLLPEDIQIYYFYTPDEVPEGEFQVYPISIDEEGALSKNFGSGFFDESSKLNIALYHFNKSAKN